MRPVIRSFALLVIASAISGCGGMVRAVKVLPDTADQLCQETRPPGQAEDCAATATP